MLHCVTFDAFVTNAAAAASNLRFSWLFPLDGAGGFAGDVVDDAVDAKPIMPRASGCGKFVDGLRDHSDCPHHIFSSRKAVLKPNLAESCLERKYKKL